MDQYSFYVLIEDLNPKAWERKKLHGFIHSPNLGQMLGSKLNSAVGGTGDTGSSSVGW